MQLNSKAGINGLVLGLVLTSAVSFVTPASAWEINIGNYGFAPTAIPWAVAVEEGFFKAEGVDLTGIRNAPGGNAARLIVAGDLAMGDGGLPEVISANAAGGDLWIVADTAHNVGGVTWVVMPDSPIKTPADMKGKRISFTAPQSITESWTHFMVEKLGIGTKNVTMIAAGGISQGLTLLEHGGTDVAVIDKTTQAKVPGKYRILVDGSDGKIFPPVNDTVAYVTGKFKREHPEIVRGLINAHRRGVEFMMANRKQAAADVARAWKNDPDLMLTLINEFIDHGTVDGVLFYGLGDINVPALETTVMMAKLVGAIEGEVNLKSMIDESFLPADLKSKK
jgi:NitT/TauT family transport system substrate-binding protein